MTGQPQMIFFFFSRDSNWSTPNRLTTTLRPLKVSHACGFKIDRYWRRAESFPRIAVPWPIPLLFRQVQLETGFLSVTFRLHFRYGLKINDAAAFAVVMAFTFVFPPLPGFEPVNFHAQSNFDDFAFVAKHSGILQETEVLLWQFRYGIC